MAVAARVEVVGMEVAAAAGGGEGGVGEGGGGDDSGAGCGGRSGGGSGWSVAALLEPSPLHPPCNTIVCRKGGGSVPVFGNATCKGAIAPLRRARQHTRRRWLRRRSGGGAALRTLPLAPRNTTVCCKGGRVGSGVHITPQCRGASAPLHGVRRAREQALSCSCTGTG